MLKIRRFVINKDEDIWIRIGNQDSEKYDDFRPTTLEDMRKEEKRLTFDTKGMFIAEWNNEPAGRVNAFIDRNREESKGFIKRLGIVPEFGRKGVDKRLVQKALQSLKERGIEEAQVSIRDDRLVYKRLLESMDFKQIRVFSVMRRDLESVPSNIGENGEVTIRQMRKDEEDIRLLTLMINESFSEHFDFRPRRFEELKCSIENDPYCDIDEFFFAYISDKPVGLIEIGVDTNFAKHTGTKRGWIRTIGVLKPYRKQGIGTRLMLFAMGFLKSYGITDVEIGVDDSNLTKAIRLYRKVGFKVIHREFTYLRKIRDI